MERHNALKVLVVVIVVAAIVPAALFGEPRTVAGVTGGNWWRNTLLDFQTLIGGLLAVFAAWWTVDTMDRTDKAAERRHDQLLRLQTRADRLVVERLLVRHLPTFRDFASVLAASEFTQKELEEPVQLRDERQNEIAALQRATARIIHMTSDEKWQAAQSLFDGQLSEQITGLLKKTVQLDTILSTARNFRTVAEMAAKNELYVTLKRREFAGTEEKHRTQIRLLQVRVDELRQQNGSVLRRMQQLADVYEIKIS